MRTSINLRAIAAAILFSAGLFFSQATAAQARELPSTLAMPVNTIVTHDESQSLANQLARGSQYYSSLSFAGTYQGRGRPLHGQKYRNQHGCRMRHERNRLRQLFQC